MDEQWTSFELSGDEDVWNMDTDVTERNDGILEEYKKLDELVRNHGRRLGLMEANLKKREEAVRLAEIQLQDKVDKFRATQDLFGDDMITKLAAGINTQVAPKAKTKNKIFRKYKVVEPKTQRALTKKAESLYRKTDNEWNMFRSFLLELVTLTRDMSITKKEIEQIANDIQKDLYMSTHDIYKKYLSKNALVNIVT